MANEAVELSTISREDAGEQGLAEENFEPAGPSFELPPTDGGKDAWLFLAACFMIEALVWGFPFAFGLFQDYYSTYGHFADSNSIAVIGTCEMGIMYLSAPFVFGSMQRWPWLRRPGVVFGLLCMCTALALSSLAQTVPQLIVTQGIMYAIGGGIAYAPTILFMNEWFVRKRGLAFGVMWGGTGVAGVVLPLVLQQLLQAYGFRTTLRIWSIALFVLVAPVAYFLKPRIPLSSRRFHSQSPVLALSSVSFLLSRPFTLFQLANIVQALGYFLPSIWLPRYAASHLNAAPIAAAGTIVAINVASVAGCIMMGSLVDVTHVTVGIALSAAGSAVAVFFFWGFADGLPLLYVFCIAYGLFAGSFSSTWTGVISVVQAKDEAADAGLVFAFLAFGRGLGNVVSGPLSEALVSGRPWLEKAAGSYGSGYGALIVFTGVSALLGGSSFFGRRIGWF